VESLKQNSVEALKQGAVESLSVGQECGIKGVGWAFRLLDQVSGLRQFVLAENR
jgi:hypothetical protein